jgi:hypothetical protein
VPDHSAGKGGAGCVRSGHRLSFRGAPGPTHHNLERGGNVNLSISVGDSRCPPGAQVAILDGDEMLSCFAGVADAVHARTILERGYQTLDCPDPDDPATDPEDCCDGDPDGEYYRLFIAGGVE